MTIYTPRHFLGDDAVARELIARHPFATLLTAGAGHTHVTHVPLLLEGDALIGHVARPNPIWRAFGDGETTAIFHGPHAFVSRGWYPDVPNNVPTWNYAVVHVTGRAEVLDAAATRGAVEALAQRFEPPSLAPIAETRLVPLLAAIVAFRLPLARVEAKVKMSQNKTADERAGVLRGLRAAGDAESLATAAWMEAHGLG